MLLVLRLKWYERKTSPLKERSSPSRLLFLGRGRLLQGEDMDLLVSFLESGLALQGDHGLRGQDPLPALPMSIAPLLAEQRDVEMVEVRREVGRSLRPISSCSKNFLVSCITDLLQSSNPTNVRVSRVICIINQVTPNGQRETTCSLWGIALISTDFSSMQTLLKMTQSRDDSTISKASLVFCNAR